MYQMQWGDESWGQEWNQEGWNQEGQQGEEEGGKGIEMMSFGGLFQLARGKRQRKVKSKMGRRLTPELAESDSEEEEATIAGTESEPVSST